MSEKLPLKDIAQSTKAPTFIAIISTLGVILAFLYETGYSFGLGISMRNILDTSDFFRTSIFSISLLAALTIATSWLFLSEGIENGEFSVDLYKERNTTPNFAPFMYVIGGFDFINFLLLGGFIGLRFWPITLGVFVASRIALANSKLLNIGFSGYFTFYICIILALTSIQKGLNDSDINIKKDEFPIALSSSDMSEWSVVRRYSSHLLVVNVDERFAVMNFDNEIVFKWKKPNRYWRGVVCSRPPDRAIGLWEIDRCWYPQFMRESTPKGG